MPVTQLVAQFCMTLAQPVSRLHQPIQQRLACIDQALCFLLPLSICRNWVRK